MWLRRQLLVVLAGVCIAWFAIGSSAEPATQPNLVKPILVLTGAFSEVSKPAYHRVRDAEAMKRVWREHIGKAYGSDDFPPPVVDFDKYEVLAIFQGREFNSHGLRIESITAEEWRTVVRFDDLSYQTIEVGESAWKESKPNCSPYAFVVIPSAQSQICVEENVQQYLGRPPEWKQVAAFDAAP